MSKRRLRSAVLLNWISLDQNRGLPLYRQVSDQIRSAILSGDLAPGTWLPASRRLAADLGVSRITTLQAYDQLTAEDFLESRRGSGTRVAANLADRPGATKAATEALFRTVPAHAEVHVQELYEGEPPWVAFQPGIPAYDAFPRLRWARLLQRHALRSDQFILDYAHIGGYAPLRHELAKYLNASRGVAARRSRSSLSPPRGRRSKRPHASSGRSAPRWRSRTRDMSSQSACSPLPASACAWCPWTNGACGSRSSFPPATRAWAPI